MCRLLIILPLLLAFGCAKPKPVPVALRDADEAFKGAEAAFVQLHTLKAEAKLEVKKGLKRARIHLDLLVADPDRLYGEASSLGMPALLLSVNGPQTLVYVPSDRRALQGKGNISMSGLIGVPVSPQEWVRVLLGRLPDGPRKIVEAKKGASELQLIAEDGGARATWVIDRKSGRLTSLIRHRPDPVTFRYKGMIETTAGSYPAVIEIETRELRASLEFQKVTVNPSFPEKDLKIELPPKVTMESLDNVQLLKTE